MIPPEMFIKGIERTDPHRPVWVHVPAIDYVVWLEEDEYEFFTGSKSIVVKLDDPKKSLPFLLD
jgi:hypothetical protein